MPTPPTKPTVAPTLHGLDMKLWQELPLPLAELGVRLDASRDDYVACLLEIAEDAVVLVGALSLARLDPAAEDAWAAAAGLLRQPSLGKRIELLWVLADGGTTARGWDPAASAEEHRALIERVNPGAVPRRPCTRDVLGAVVKLRNDTHHRRLLQESRQDATRLLEGAVFWLLGSCPVLREPLFWVDEVRRTAGGGEELTAWSLSGPAKGRFRRGQWQSTRAGTLPHRVVQGDLASPAELDPFVVVRDERVYVLDEVKGTKPVLRHFASRDALAQPPAFDDRWPGLTSASTVVTLGAPTLLDASPAFGVRPPSVMDATVVEPAWGEAGPAAATPARRSPGCASVGLALALVLGVVGVSLTAGVAWWWSARPGAPGEVAPGSVRSVRPAPAAPTCPVTLAPGRAAHQDLARALSGAPLAWGSTPSELDRACAGSTTSVPTSACRAALVQMRSTPWAPAWALPSRTETHLAFHPSRGLFEVMVYSHAEVEALAAAVEQRLGAPHRVEGRGRIWDYPSGTRLRVSPLVNHALGRSAIRVFHPPVAAMYGQSLRDSGCR